MAAPRKKNDGRGRMGGRKKGTPNKTTAELREALTPIISRYFNGEGVGSDAICFEKDIQEMEPLERARAMAGVLPYVMPKLASVEVKDAARPKTFKDELAELAEKEE